MAMDKGLYTDTEPRQPKSYTRVLVESTTGNSSVPRISTDLGTQLSCLPQTLETILSHKVHKLGDPVDNDHDWSEVSSVTSCNWPASTLSESVTGDDIHQHAEMPMSTTSVPDTCSGDDDNIYWQHLEDTRTAHAQAGRIKHEKKAKRRHLVRNLPSMDSYGSEYYYEPVIQRKPWTIKQFPATGYTPPKICPYIHDKHQGQIKQALEQEVLMKDIIPKPINRKRTKR